MVNPSPLLLHVLTVFLIWVLVPPTHAIKCFRCNSNDDPKCDKDSAPGEAIPADDCYQEPKTMFKDWVLSTNMNDYGLGVIDFDAAFKLADKEGMKAAGMQNFTACAYFYASTENKVTETVDKGISEVKGAFGGDDKSTTVHRWIYRDCATLTLKEGQKEKLDKCEPVDGHGVIKLFYCTCVEDSCNEGPEKNELLAKTIKEVTGGASVLISLNNSLFLWSGIIGILSMTM